MFRKIIHAFKDIQLQAKIYFYLFILVNLIPSLFLFFTEPYNLSGSLLLVLLPLNFVLILTSLSRRVAYVQSWMLPIFFFHAFQLVVFSLFKEDVIAVDMFLNLATTNASEAGELLGSILIPTLVACFTYILFIGATIYLFRKKIYFSPYFRRNNLVLGIIGFVASCFLFTSAQDVNTKRFTLHENVYPANIFYNMGFAINKLQKVNNYPNTSKGFSFAASKADKRTDEREIYVLVIGETARADNWSLYGYGRETSPRLAADPGVVTFRDVLTQSNTTHKSVSILLSAASAENYNCIYQQKSLVQAFNEAGFTSVFLSNQAKNGSFVEFFAREATYTEYYRSQVMQTNHYDTILLDRLEHYIEHTTGNLLVVMHTYGSHFNYGERYPKEFKKFTPDEFSRIDRKNKEQMVNAYDNSILYTDYFLSRIGDLLSESKSCSSFLYISDHGEDIMDDERERFLHASPNPTYYQLRVPFIAWFSPIYKKVYPDKYARAINNRLKPVASNVVFHTFLDIADVQTTYKQAELSLVNSQFTVTARMYLGDHDNPVPYYQMSLKKQDKAMIEKNQLSIE